MNDQKLIKKIFSLAYYDFSNNFTRWLSIVGLHAIIISIIFYSLCFVTSDYDVTYWGWAPNIIFDWTNKLYNLILGDAPTWMLGGMSLVLVTGVILLPLVIIQNCLDLAFDSSMRGYSMNSVVFSYIGAMIIGNGLLLLFMQLISSVVIFAMLYWMQASLIMNSFAIKAFMLVMSWFILYFMQKAYFLSMHILEYKVGIWQSCKEVHCMLIGKFLFLSKILFLQIFTGICVLTMLYLCLGTVIGLIMPIIVWIFTVLQLSIEPVFIYMMYNFFYLWAYILLYAWVCLVAAHVYRQLVCPPADNVACSSCQSCEK